MLCEKCSAVNLQFIDELPENRQEQVRSLNFGDLYYWTRANGDSPHWYYYVWHEDLPSLLRSAKHGCHLCAVAYTGLTDPPTWWATEGWKVRPISTTINTPLVMRSWSRKDRRSFSQLMLDKTWGSLYREIEVASIHGKGLKLMLTSDLADALVQPSYELGSELVKTGTIGGDSTTGSQASLILLKEWLEDCKARHKPCALATSTIPTRVIDVGTSRNATEPRVIEPQVRPSNGYIALSHCWGDPKAFGETQAWAADPSNLLPLHQWPPTFRQAVQIARFLDIPYLWIDSVCINQKDETDWAKEGSRMAEYYTGATLTIAADHAKDAREGCFAARSPLCIRPCPIGFVGLEDKKFFVNIQPHSERKASTAATSTPLRSRAWCLQEGLLARRTVNFCHDQLHWSCILNKASEDNPQGKRIDDIHPQNRPLPFLRAFLHHPPPNSPPETETQSMDAELRAWRTKMIPSYSVTMSPTRNVAYQKWYDCVEAFSNRKITFPGDVFPAMSGLAQKMHSAIGPEDQYRAGLWQQDIVRGLLWAVFTGSLPRKDDPKVLPRYIAPTWSWASRVGCRISYFFDEFIMCDEAPEHSDKPNMQQLMDALRPMDLVVESDLKYARAAYGEVTGARIRCSAMLLHAGKVGERLAMSIYRKPHPAYHRGLGGTQLDDLIMNWKLTVEVPWAAEKDGGKANDSGGAEIEGEIALDVYHPAYVLAPWKFPVVSDPVSILLLWPFKYEGDRTIGLGLVKTGNGPNEYKRVGRVEFVIPHFKLWSWIRGDAKAEDIVII